LQVLSRKALITITSGYGLGSIEGGKPIEIMNVMVLNFFDKYLKKKHNIDLTEKAGLFSEIEIAKNIK
jgi:hypothetical protein